MRQPFSETRFGCIRIIVVDRMVIACHIGERPEFIISNLVGLAGEDLPYLQIIGEDLRRSSIAHFGFRFACTTTGKSLRLRSGCISTILADWLPSRSVALKVVRQREACFKALQGSSALTKAAWVSPGPVRFRPSRNTSAPP